MTREIAVRPKPEDAELEGKRKELQDLENQLLERELYLAEIHRDLASFEQRYLKIVGVKYAELDELQALIAELRARREPSVKTQSAARDARARADKSNATSTKALTERERFSPSPTLKSLYKEIARRIHPDLATDEQDRERRQKLMAEANLAYEEGDEARLRAILEDYESSPETVEGEGAGADLVRVIRKIAQIRRRLVEIDRKVRDIVESEWFELKEKVAQAKEQGRDLLTEMASAVNGRIEAAKASLRKENSKVG